MDHLNPQHQGGNKKLEGGSFKTRRETTQLTKVNKTTHNTKLYFVWVSAIDPSGRPWEVGRAYTLSTGPLTGFQGPTSKEREREGRGVEMGREERQGRGGCP